MNVPGETTRQQNLALILEVQTAVRLVCIGLAELQNIDGASDFYHLPFLLLSSGFERLMKCMICIKQHHDTGAFPSANELKTHDLVDLKRRVLSECISEETASKRAATREDYQYLKADEDLGRLLEMLSRFGRFARYYNLDVVTGNTEPTVDVQQIWCQYESELASKHEWLAAFWRDPKRANECFREITRIIVGSLERFARALARQFTLGELGEDAKTHTAAIKRFLFLRDDQLGNVDYRMAT